MCVKTNILESDVWSLVFHKQRQMVSTAVQRAKRVSRSYIYIGCLSGFGNLHQWTKMMTDMENWHCPGDQKYRSFANLKRWCAGVTSLALQNMAQDSCHARKTSSKLALKADARPRGHKFFRECTNTRLNRACFSERIVPNWTTFVRFGCVSTSKTCVWCLCLYVLSLRSNWFSRLT